MAKQPPHPNDEGKFSLAQLKNLEDHLGKDLAGAFAKFHGVEDPPKPEEEDDDT
jgi:hypothetical protein